MFINIKKSLSDDVSTHFILRTTMKLLKKNEKSKNFPLEKTKNLYSTISIWFFGVTLKNITEYNT